ncbi:MAG: hypothetical protein LBU32_31555 [Clostridiales bacterium]|nr:hypothetical protein [Clostridiales bacterium]
MKSISVILADSKNYLSDKITTVLHEPSASEWTCWNSLISWPCDGHKENVDLIAFIVHQEIKVSA